MTSQARSKIMSAIKGKNTRPELLVRRQLYRMGFRYRIHYQKLVGKPDIVLHKYKAIILVHGCFRHGHNCHIFKPPSSQKWRDKILRNKERDAQNIKAYQKAGWKVLVVWECSTQGKTKLPLNELAATLSSWIQYDGQSAEITGREASVFS